MQPPNVILQQITMLGEARDILMAALAEPNPQDHPAPVAVGVDEAMVERACKAYWSDSGNDWPPSRDYEIFGESIRSGMRAALTAALEADR
jgi:hypothetical protein